MNDNKDLELGKVISKYTVVKVLNDGYVIEYGGTLNKYQAYKDMIKYAQGDDGVFVVFKSNYTIHSLRQMTESSL